MSANIHVYFNYTAVFLNYFKNKVAKLMTTYIYNLLITNLINTFIIHIFFTVIAQRITKQILFIVF